jgi:hypothetical protein
VRAAIGFGIVCLILQLILAYLVQPNFPPDVSERFIERHSDIPSMVNTTKDKGHLSLTNLSAWISNPANEKQRRGYVTPIILPLDLLFLVALGCLLGSVSQLFAKHVRVVSAWNPWRWWFFPVAYMLCDFIEDTIIVLVLSEAIPLTYFTFYFLRTATIAKLFTVTVATIQAVLLLVLWCATWLGRLRHLAA